eukprot:CAMPEP_0176256216 /NCGR_PEP_ID=MMETSP0121_2-20121125/37432_1 /TAXON_ID=160619 /ORGANISM="Kryptoperidinium foliaceum, Strain CCMP 1326" /LENGTH=41 /DNA_ID= /DNA_START= /DNA_END= /DNA_ORIENTATION=
MGAPPHLAALPSSAPLLRLLPFMRSLALALLDELAATLGPT